MGCFELRAVGAKSIAGVAMLSLAAAVQAAGQSGMLEEVVVTAQKKAESLQDTPIAISAFGAESLEQIGAQSAADVGEFTPNATITPSLGSSFNVRASIRGIGTAEPSLSVDPKVGIYVDGVYVARNAGSVFDVVDLERIEVLRGPQGTLWGKNTTGGAINMVTQKPSGEFGGKAQVSLGKFGYQKTSITVDTPDVAGFSAKVSAVNKQKDGWADNYAPGAASDLGSEDTDAYRLAVRWDATDRLMVDYSFDYTDGEAVAIPAQPGIIDASTNPAVPTIDVVASAIAGSPVFLPTNPYEQMAAIATNDKRLDKYNLDAVQAEEVKITGHTLTLNYQFDTLEVRSITAYRDYQSDDNGLDLDGGSYTDINGSGLPLPIFQVVGEKTQDQLSQEFQFIGTALDDSLSYVVGLYYFEEDGEEINPWQITNYVPSLGVNYYFNGLLGAFYEMENESKAVYGQFTYDATDRLSVTLGLRYTEDEKTLILSQKDPRLQGTTAATSATEDWSKFTSALTFDYIVNDDINVYAKVSEGFAAGIFNPGTVGVGGDTTAALTPADPEELTSYEIGLKSRLFDNRVQLNGAIFYNDSDNLQTTDFVDGVRQTLNTGGSQSKGIELELIAMLTDNLLINANYGYNDTEANDFTDPVTGDVKPRYVTAPHNTGAVGIQHDLPLDFGLLTSRLDVTYTDRQGYSASDKRVEGDERTLVNARVGLSEVVVPGGDITVALWGRNLTDEEYIQHGANYGSFVGFAWGEPRSYGVDVTYNF